MKSVFVRPRRDAKTIRRPPQANNDEQPAGCELTKQRKSRRERRVFKHLG